MRFLGKVSAMRSRSGSPADMDEVELDRGKALGPPTASSEQADLPVRSPRVLLMRRGVKKPARLPQLLPPLLATWDPPPDGFCPKVAPQQRDWVWVGSPWEWDGEAENPPRMSGWGSGGGPLKAAVGSYFLWGWVSISRKELLLLGGVGMFCCSWDVEEEVDEDDADFFFMKELKKPALRSRVKVPVS